MVDQDVLAGHLEGQLRDQGAARRHVHGLHVMRGAARDGPERVDLVEDLADDVEAEVMFGPPTPKKIRTVSPTFAFSGVSVLRPCTEPLKT